VSVSAVIPAYNEEGWVGRTAAALWSVPEVGEVIVVDDGSVDNTYREAREAGAAVFRFEKNQGKSSAMRKGVELSSGDIVAFVDADLRETAREIKKLIRAIQLEEADMVIAHFKTKDKAESPSGLGLVKLLAYWGIYIYTGEKMLSPLSGQRVLKRKVWDSLNFPVEGYAAEVALTIESVRRGYRVKEVPVNMSHRFTGNDREGFYHRGQQFFAVLKTLMQGHSLLAGSRKNV